MTGVERLAQDPWFAPLHQRTARAGFEAITTTAEGRSGWFLDPLHLIEHIQAQGVKLRWAYSPQDPRAREALEAAVDVMAHCEEALTPAHRFVGSFATLHATFLLFAGQAVFNDDKEHLALAFCLPGDVLQTGFPAVPTTIHNAPWVAKTGMVDCLELCDTHEGRLLLSMGTLTRGHDLHTIFAPSQPHFELARTWVQRDSLDANTPRAQGQAQRGTRL